MATMRLEIDNETWECEMDLDLIMNVIQAHGDPVQYDPVHGAGDERSTRILTAMHNALRIAVIEGGVK